MRAKEENGLEINNRIIRHYLKNVYFINGTAYAGKSTMVAMLAEKYGMIERGENYHFPVTGQLATPEEYPNLCYFETVRDWQEFLNRTPEDYAKWIEETSNELIGFEIAELMHISKDRKVIVDTSIPPEVLKKIADHHQVAIMLSPQSMSVDRFFDRGDQDKQFLLSHIQQAEDPEKTMENFRECIARVNSRESYEKFLNSGFFTIVREENGEDTREETLEALAKHFRLE